jgi:preprotein translocase subunit YajC
MTFVDPFLIALGTPPPGTNASPWLQLIPFVLILGIFYFVMIMPMRKRQQKVQEFQGGLKIGDKVITSGGIFGSITRVSEQSVQLQVANNVRIEVSRPAIVGFQGQEPVVPEGNQQ